MAAMRQRKSTTVMCTIDPASSRVDPCCMRDCPMCTDIRRNGKGGGTNATRSRALQPGIIDIQSVSDVKTPSAVATIRAKCTSAVGGLSTVVQSKRVGPYTWTHHLLRPKWPLIDCGIFTCIQCSNSNHATRSVKAPLTIVCCAHVSAGEAGYAHMRLHWRL